MSALPIPRSSLRELPAQIAMGPYSLRVEFRERAQLYSGLTGSNLAVVALHEITHAVHHMYDLKKRDLHRNFRHAQLKGWLGIIKQNPSAWRWLVWVISFPAKASLAPVAPEAA